MSSYCAIFGRSARLELRYLMRSRWDLAMLVWLPLLSIMLLWWIFSAGQANHLPIAVLDNDHSSESQMLIQMLNAAPGLEVTEIVPSKREAQHAIRAARVYAVVLISSDFSRHLKSGHPAPVVAWVNAQYGTHSGIIQRDLRRVIGTFSAGVARKLRLARGEAPEQILAHLRPLVIDAPFVFNINTDYQSFIAASLIPALLHILATVVGAYAIGRELRDRTLRTTYRGSVHPQLAARISFFGMWAFLHGKLSWAFCCYAIWGALLVSLITLHQSITTLGWWLCFAAYLCLMMLSLWLGVLLTVVPISLRMGLSGVALITAPAYAFSGMTFPLHMMPDGAQWIANLLPLTHYLHIQVMLVDAGASAVDVLPVLMRVLLAAWLLSLCANVFAYRALHHPERWGSR